MIKLGGHIVEKESLVVLVKNKYVIKLGRFAIRIETFTNFVHSGKVWKHFYRDENNNDYFGVFFININLV